MNKNIKRQNPLFQEQTKKNMKMLMDKITPKNPFSLQSVCPLPFERSILEVGFPKKHNFLIMISMIGMETLVIM